MTENTFYLKKIVITSKQPSADTSCSSMHATTRQTVKVIISSINSHEVPTPNSRLPSRRELLNITVMAQL